MDTAKKAKSVENLPVIYTKFVLAQLIDALESVLMESKALETLTIEGLPLKERYLLPVVKGLAHNSSIESLSFSRCKIGDAGCETICGAIKYKMKIKVVNFSSCNLGVAGATSVADLIKFQKIQRFSEAWAESLRYRDVDPDSHLGIRQVFLNNNPQVGEKGLEAITDVLQEDCWIKDVEVRLLKFN